MPTALASVWRWNGAAVGQKSGKNKIGALMSSNFNLSKVTWQDVSQWKVTFRCDMVEWGSNICKLVNVTMVVRGKT